MPNQHFIGYVSFGIEEKFTPVATGTTRDECMEKTVQRALVVRALHGQICVQYRPEVSIPDFAKLTHVTEQFFSEKFPELAPFDDAKKGNTKMPVEAFLETPAPDPKVSYAADEWRPLDKVQPEEGQKIIPGFQSPSGVTIFESYCTYAKQLPDRKDKLQWVNFYVENGAVKTRAFHKQPTHWKPYRGTM